MIKISMGLWWEKLFFSAVDIKPILNIFVLCLDLFACSFYERLFGICEHLKILFFSLYNK